MAYCRFSRRSDLYVYADIRGGLTCCGCKLGSPQTPGGHGESFNCATRGEMLAHVETHRAAGHRIEDDLVQQLREELARLGDTVGADEL